VVNCFVCVVFSVGPVQVVVVDVVVDVIVDVECGANVVVVVFVGGGVVELNVEDSPTEELLTMREEVGIEEVEVAVIVVKVVEVSLGSCKVVVWTPKVFKYLVSATAGVVDSSAAPLEINLSCVVVNSSAIVCVEMSSGGISEFCIVVGAISSEGSEKPALLEISSTSV